MLANRAISGRLQSPREPFLKFEVPLEFQGLEAHRRGTVPGSPTCPARSIVAREDGIVSGMAGRYARALFELALEEKVLDRVKADLDDFDALVMENPDLARLVRSPVFSSEEQFHAITAVLERVGIGGLAGNFLKVAARNRRLFAVQDMVEVLPSLVARPRGEISAAVTVAGALNWGQPASIKDVLG